MRNTNKRTTWIASLALVALLAACKGDSPTAPPTTTGGPVTPPTSGANITLAVANPSPVTNSSTAITATVTVNGSPAPNGTAVEFTSNTTGAVFTDTNTQSTIRTTTNGVASVVLTSVNAGTVTVTAFVGGSSRSTNVIFRVPETTEPQQPSTPSITAVAPAGGRPEGGQTVTITGRNLRGPRRVQFDFGNGVVRDAIIVSESDTEIRVLSPAIEVISGQSRNATIRVFTQVGSVTEQAVVAPTPFVYTFEVLTPRLVTALPAEGNPEGGTRVVLRGDGFQYPVQVFFGSAQAEIVGIPSFTEIVVMTPPSRSTDPNASAPITGPVPVTVVNIASGTRVTVADVFRYIPGMAIVSFTPLRGPATGGTDITIDGIGFQDPVQVIVAGVEAQVTRVSGSQIRVRTLPTGSPCAGASGSIRIINVSTGSSTDSAANFTFIPVLPTITSIAGLPVAPGGTVTVTVVDPGVGPLGTGLIRFLVNGVAVIPTPSTISSGSGSTVFTVPIPATGITFPTIACTTTGGAPGTRFGPTLIDLSFLNASTQCAVIAEDSVRVELPAAQNPCLSSPSPTVTTPAGGSCATPATASVTSVGFPGQTQSSIVITNGPDAAPLNITGVALSGANASEFRITPTTASNIAANGTANFTLTFDPTTAGTKDATVTFTTNSTITPTLTVCVQASAAP